jgi:hypothetical protein
MESSPNTNTATNSTQLYIKTFKIKGWCGIADICLNFSPLITITHLDFKTTLIRGIALFLRCVNLLNEEKLKIEQLAKSQIHYNTIFCSPQKLIHTDEFFKIFGKTNLRVDWGNNEVYEFEVTGEKVLLKQDTVLGTISLSWFHFCVENENLTCCVDGKSKSLKDLFLNLKDQNFVVENYSKLCGKLEKTPWVSLKGSKRSIENYENLSSSCRRVFQILILIQNLIDSKAEIKVALIDDLDLHLTKDQITDLMDMIANISENQSIQFIISVNKSNSDVCLTKVNHLETKKQSFEQKT